MVAAGIGAGIGASYLMSKYDVANKVADGASWLGGKIADGWNSSFGGGSRRNQSALMRGPPEAVGGYA